MSNCCSKTYRRRRTDAEVSLFLLASNSVLYEGLVNDPFYLATVPFHLTENGTDFAYYVSDRYVSVLGCTDQHQFCDPLRGNCTQLTTSALVFDEITTIGLNNVQVNTALRVGYSMLFLNTFYSVNSRGASALRASETVNNGFQIALPDNQWITEVSSWFAVSLAKLQQKTVQYATGSPSTSDALQLAGPLNKEQANMCKSQIIRSQSGTTSFSMLGISIILVLGGNLIMTSLVIDTLVGWIRRKFHWNEHKSLQWTLDEKLQPQRLAYEEAGQGRWSCCAGPVPVMKRVDNIGVPEHLDKMHPRLSQRSDLPEPVDGGGYEMAEAEGLMAQKRMGYRVDSLHDQELT